MFREFNVRFENVEMIDGADNLLENTSVTKIIVRGDNKMSSLNYTLKNCTQLDTIDGAFDVSGVRDINYFLDSTPLVKEITLKNINTENIQAEKAFDNIDMINIDGVSTKKGLQGFLKNFKWNYDKFGYVGDMLERSNLITHVFSPIQQTVIADTVERASRGLEIHGQTYQNLIDGKKEELLVDDFDFTVNAFETKQFDYPYESKLDVKEIVGNTIQNVITNPNNIEETCDFLYSKTGTTHTIANSTDSKIRVDELLGSTYQNVITNPNNEEEMCDFLYEGSSTNHTITDSVATSIKIDELVGNTVQGTPNAMSMKQFVDMQNSITYSTTRATYVDSRTLKYNSTMNITIWNVQDNILENGNNALRLKPNTTYTFCNYTGLTCFICSKTKEYYNGYSKYIVFTTDSTNIYVGIVLNKPIVGTPYQVRLLEGDYSSGIDMNFDSEYIQSVGDWSEEDNAFKIEVLSSGKNLFNSELMEYAYNESYTSITSLGTNDFLATTTSSSKIGVYFYYTPTKNGVLYVGAELNNCEIYVWGISENMFIHSSSERGVKFICVKGQTYQLDFKCSTTGSFSASNIQLEFDSHTQFQKTYDKKQILLPIQLQKVDSISDKLFYDESKKKWCIEKKIVKLRVKDSPQTGWDNQGDWNNLYRYAKTLPSNIPLVAICDKYDMSVVSNQMVGIGKNWNARLYVNYPSNSNYTGDMAGMYKWLEEIDPIVYYVTNEPQIIETEYTDPNLFKLTTYDEITYITSNTEILPTININSVGVKRDCILKANTKYTVNFTTSLDAELDIGGTKVNVLSTDKQKIVTTPSTLVHSQVRLARSGTKVKDLKVVEGDISLDGSSMNYFEGIESVGNAYLSPNIFNCTNFTDEWWNDAEIKGAYYHKKLGTFKPNTTYEIKVENCIVDSGKYYNYGINVNYSVLDGSSCMARDGSGVFLGGYDNTKGSSAITVTGRTTSITTNNTGELILSGYNPTVKGSGWLEQMVNLQIEEGNVATESKPFGWNGFKIEILSKSNNIYPQPKAENFTMENPNGIKFNANSITFTASGTWTSVACDYVVRPNTKYTIGLNIIKNTLNNYIVQNINPSGIFTPNFTTGETGFKKKIITTNSNSIGKFGYKISSLVTSGELEFQLMIYEGEYTGDKFIPNDIDKKQILLPVQLQKVGNVSDRFYYDTIRGKWCIEKNIVEEILNTTNFPTYFTGVENDWGMRISFQVKPNTKQVVPMFDKIPVKLNSELHGSGISKYNYTFGGLTIDNLFRIYVKDVFNNSDLFNYFNELNNKVFYVTTTPQIIETSYTDKDLLKFDTYPEITYINAQTTILPIMPINSVGVKRDCLLKPNTKYTVDFSTSLDAELDLGGNKINVLSTDTQKVITTPSTLTHSQLRIAKDLAKVKDLKVIEGDYSTKNKIEYIEGINSCGEYDSVSGKYRIDIVSSNGSNVNKISILIDEPLRKVGDVADRLYWDKDKGHYCVERNLVEINAVDGLTEDFTNATYTNVPDDNNYMLFESNLYGFNLPNPLKGTQNSISICSSLIYGLSVTRSGIYRQWSRLYLRLNKKDLLSLDNNGIIEWLNRNSVKIIYIPVSPIIEDLPQYNVQLYSNTFIGTNYYNSTNIIEPSTMFIGTTPLEHDVELLPSTTYMVRLDEDKNDSVKNIKVELGGATTTINTDEGYSHKVTTLTTPATITNNKLKLTGVGVKAKNVMLLKESVTEDLPYFDGIMSCGEHEYNEETGKYNINIKSYNKEDEEFSGENLVIENTTGNEILEIDEIHGNTWQNSDNLSEIISVGELQEDGQYKVDVRSSTCVNLINLSNMVYGYKLNIDGQQTVSDGECYCDDYIDVRYDKKLHLSGNGWKNIHGYDENKQYLRRLHDSVATDNKIIIPSDVSYIKVGGQYPAEINCTSGKFQLTYGHVKLEYVSNYVEPISNKSSILLPQPLMVIKEDKSKLEKLYWSDESQYYKLDNFHGKITLNGSENYAVHTETSTYVRYKLIMSYNDYVSYNILRWGHCWSDRFKYYATIGSPDQEDFKIRPGDGFNEAFIFVIYKTHLTSYDANGFKDWLSKNPTTIYFERSTPQTIDIPHLNQKITINSQPVKTHILTGNINASYIKCTNTHGLNQTFSLDQPLAENDKLYWDKDKRHFCIDNENGDTIDLPQYDKEYLIELYQEKDTKINCSNAIKPETISIDYIDVV